MPPVEGDSACLLLGVALCASQQHGGLPILTYPKDSPLLIDWDCICRAASGAADATSVGVLQLQSCVLAYQSSHHGYVLLLVGNPPCPHSILRTKAAELLNLTDLLLGETLGRTLSAAPTRELLQLRLPKHADLLETLLHPNVGEDMMESASRPATAFSTSSALSATAGVINAPVPPGTLEALLERRLRAVSVLPLPAPGVGSRPAAARRTFLPDPIAAAFQELRRCVPHRIGSHHVDLTAALPQHAVRLVTADMAAGRGTRAGMRMVTGMDSVLFSDLAAFYEHGHDSAKTTPSSEGQQEERHAARGMRAMRDMLQPPDSQLWALILSELHALDVVNMTVDGLIQNSNGAATSSCGISSQRQLCSIDLSALHPGLIASVVVLHLGTRLPGDVQPESSAGSTPATHPYDGGSGMYRNYGSGGRTSVTGRREAGPGDAVSSAVVVRRHCLVAIVVVYVLMDQDKASWELWSRDGAGGGAADTAAAVAATCMRESSFRGLQYSIAIGPLAAPPVVRAVLMEAAGKYEQAFPSTAAEVWRELRMVASERRRSALELELEEQPAARLAISDGLRAQLHSRTSFQPAELDEPTLTPISAMSDSPEKLCSPSSQMLLDTPEVEPQSRSSALGGNLAPAPMGDGEVTDKTANFENAAETQKSAANQGAPTQGSAAASRGASAFATRASPPDWMLGSLSSSSSSSMTSPFSSLNISSSIRPARASSSPAACAYPFGQHKPASPAPGQPDPTLTAVATAAATPVNQNAALPGWSPTRVSSRKSAPLPSLSQPLMSTDSNGPSLPGLEEMPVASQAGSVAAGASEPAGGSFRPPPTWLHSDKQLSRDRFVPSPLLVVVSAGEQCGAAGSHDDDDTVVMVSPDGDASAAGAAASADGPFARALASARAAAAGNVEESVSGISRFGSAKHMDALAPVPAPALVAVASNLSPPPMVAMALGEGRELAAADIGGTIGGQEIPVSTSTRPEVLRSTGGDSPDLRVSNTSSGADAVAAAVAAVAEAAGGLGVSQGMSGAGGVAAAVVVRGCSPVAVSGSRSQHGSEKASRDGAAHAGGMVAASPAAISASSTGLAATISTGINGATTTSAIKEEPGHEPIGNRGDASGKSGGNGNSRPPDLGSSGPWPPRRTSVPILRLNETATSGGNSGAIDECPTPSLIHFSSLSSLSRFKQPSSHWPGNSETDAVRNTAVSALTSQLRQGVPAADPRAAIRIAESPRGLHLRSAQPGSPGTSGPTASRQQATAEQLLLLPEPTVSAHLSAASDDRGRGAGSGAASATPPRQSISSSDEGSAAAGRCSSGGGSLGAASLRGSTHSLVSILNDVERQCLQLSASPEAAAVTAVRESPDHGSGSSSPRACEGDATVSPGTGSGSFDAVVNRAPPAASSPSGMVQVPFLPLQELQQQSLGGIVTSPRMTGPKAAGRYAAATGNSPPGALATVAAAQHQHIRFASAVATAMPGSMRIPHSEEPMAASLSLLQLQELQQLRQLDQTQQLQQLLQPSSRQLILSGSLQQQQQQQQQLLVQLLQASGEIQAAALLLLQQQIQQQRPLPQRLQMQELPEPAQQLQSGLPSTQQLENHHQHRHPILDQTQQLSQGPQLRQQQQLPGSQTTTTTTTTAVARTPGVALLVGTDTTSLPLSPSPPPPGDTASTKSITANTTATHDKRMEASVDGWARETFPLHPHVHFQSQLQESQPGARPGQAPAAMAPGRQHVSIDPVQSISNHTFRPHLPAANATVGHTAQTASTVSGKGLGDAAGAGGRARGNGSRHAGCLELAGRPQRMEGKEDGCRPGNNPQPGNCYRQRRWVCRNTPPLHQMSSSSSPSGSSPSSPTLPSSSSSLQSCSLGMASEVVHGSAAQRDGFPGFHRHEETGRHRQSRSRSRSRRSHSCSCKRRYHGHQRSQSPRMGRLGQSWDALRPPLPPPPGWMSTAPHLVGVSRLDRRQGQHRRAGVTPKDTEGGPSPVAVAGSGANANTAGAQGLSWFHAPGVHAQEKGLGYTVPHSATDPTLGRRPAPAQQGAAVGAYGGGVDQDRNPSNSVQQVSAGTGIGAVTYSHGGGGNGGDLSAYNAGAVQLVSPPPPLSAIFYPPPAIEAGAEALRHFLSDRQPGLPIAAYGLKLRDAVHLVVGSIVHSRHRGPVEIVAPPQQSQPASRVNAGNPFFRGLAATTLATTFTTAATTAPVTSTSNPLDAGTGHQGVSSRGAAVAANLRLPGRCGDDRGSADGTSRSNSPFLTHGRAGKGSPTQGSQDVTTSGVNLGSVRDDAVNSKGSPTPPRLPSKCQPLSYVHGIGGDSKSLQPCMSGLEFVSVTAAAAAAAAAAAVMAASPKQSTVRPGVLARQMGEHLAPEKDHIAEQLPGPTLPLQQSPAWHGNAGADRALARSPSLLPSRKSLHRGSPRATVTTVPTDLNAAAPISSSDMPSAAYISSAGVPACQQSHQHRAQQQHIPLQYQYRAMCSPGAPSHHQGRFVPQPVVHRLVKVRMQQQQGGHNHERIAPQERQSPPDSPHYHHQCVQRQQRQRSILASPRSHTASILQMGANSTPTRTCSSACWVPKRSGAQGQHLLGLARLAAVERRHGMSAHVDMQTAISNCPLSVNDDSSAAEEIVVLGSPHTKHPFNVRDRERRALPHHQMLLLSPKSSPGKEQRLPLAQQTKLSPPPPQQQQQQPQQQPPPPPPLRPPPAPPLQPQPLPQKSHQPTPPPSQQPPPQQQRQPLSRLGKTHIWNHKLPSTWPQPPTSVPPPTDKQQQSLARSLATGVIVPWVRILSRATRLTRARRAIALAAQAARFSEEDHQDAKDAGGPPISSLPSPQLSINVLGRSSDCNDGSSGCEVDYCTIAECSTAECQHLNRNGSGRRAMHHSTGFGSTTSPLASDSDFLINSSGHTASFASAASAVKAAEMVVLGDVTATALSTGSSSRITSLGNAGSVITLSPRSGQNWNAESQQSLDLTEGGQQQLQQQQQQQQQAPAAHPLQQQQPDLWPSFSGSDACVVDAGTRTATVENLHIVTSPQQHRTSGAIRNLSRDERSGERSMVIAERWPSISGTTFNPPTTRNVGVPGLLGPLAGSAISNESGNDGDKRPVQSPDTIDLLPFLRPLAPTLQPAGGGDGCTRTSNANATALLGAAHPPTAESWMVASPSGSNTARLFSIYDGRGWARSGAGGAAITKARYSPRHCSSSQAVTEGIIYSSSSSMNFCTGAAGGPSFSSSGYNGGDYLSADFASSWSVSIRDRNEAYSIAE